MNKEEPYLIETEVVTHYRYNPNYGDDRKCRCGHYYYRHFDTYADMDSVGCKYCWGECDGFEEDVIPFYENANGV